jgi:hypothetical protein
VAILGILYSQSLDQNLYFQLFRTIANVLELCNFALNFYIYFLCSKEFRKKFLSFFTVLLPYQKNRQENQTLARQENTAANNMQHLNGNGNKNHHVVELQVNQVHHHHHDGPVDTL